MRFLLLLVFCFSCVASKAVVGQRVVDFFIDNAGKEYYLLTDDNFVTNNPLGQNQFAYYDSSLGAPASIDVSDPFAILLFYPEYGTVVVLDRTLSELGRIDLFALNEVRQPEALARASDRGTWVFDAWDYRLKLLNPGGGLRLQSNDLRLELKLSEAPSAIFVDRGTVLLHYAAEQKLAVFTNYGRFKHWVDLPTAEHFGWRPPYLTGNAAVGYWTYKAGNKEAGPQVQGKLKGKVIAGPATAYYLNAEGTVQAQVIDGGN